MPADIAGGRVTDAVPTELKQRSRVLVTARTMQIRRGDGCSTVLKERQFLDAKAFEPFEVVDVSAEAEVV